MTQGWNDSGPKRSENAVAVVEQERTCGVVHLIIWLSIFVRVRIFWTSNIFVIIVFPYTHDTDAVTGTEPGDEFYTLPLIEINIAASNLSIPPSAYVMQPNSGLLRLDATTDVAWNYDHR